MSNPVGNVDYALELIDLDWGISAACAVGPWQIHLCDHFLGPASVL